MLLLSNTLQFLSTVIVSSVLMMTHVMAAELNQDKKTDAEFNKDYRTFHVDGKIDYGNISDSYDADLVIYMAGNQFMVVEPLIQAFQKKNPDIKSVYVSTMPPGQILQEQLLQQGEVNGQPTAMNPDLYASVSMAHLQKLHEKELMNDYLTYAHNKLELMVAAGNPKNIKGVKDLARKDIVQSHPNPVTEGIFQIHGRNMLRQVGLLEEVTNNQEVIGDWAIPDRVWFTERHHRETPDRIQKGLADVGIVWATEVIEAQDEGLPIEGVAIEAPYNQQDKVNYIVGMLKTGKNPYNASRFLAFLAGAEGQQIYADHGFVKANDVELRLKSIPSQSKP